MSRDRRPGVFQRLGQVFQLRSTPRHVEREIDDELTFHFQKRVDELVAQGMSVEEARDEAQRRFGDVDGHRRGLESIGRRRDSMERRAQWWEVTKGNLRYGLRSLKQSPGFTATVVVTLALGIGANATMFGVVDRLLLSPPEGVSDADGLRRMYVTRGLDDTQYTSATTTYPDYDDWTRAETFEVAGWQSRNITLGRGEQARRARSTATSANYFDVLGVSMQLGRYFTEQEDLRRAPVVVISDDFWHSEFDAAADVLGRPLEVGEATLTVIGVASPGFAGINLQRVEMWLPLRTPARAEDPADWENHRNYYWLRTIARVPEGSSEDAVNAEATALHLGGRADTGYDENATVALAPLVESSGPRASDNSRVAQWLGGVSAIVLLIACANVANLLLARGMRRRREIGIRLALGISRMRLIAQLVTESVLLAVLGGVGAIAIAYWGGLVMRSVLLPDVYFPESPVSLRVLGFTLAASALAGLAAGLVPALQSTRPNPVDVLRAGSRGGTAQRSMTRSGLLVLQAALSALLLVAAGLFVLSLNEAGNIDIGINPDPVVLAIPEIEGNALPTEEQTMIFRSAVDRLEQLPSVQTVAASGGSTPFLGSWAVEVRVPGRDGLPQIASGGPYYIAATPGIFDTLGLDIVEGRAFDPGADATTAPVAVVNETMARLVWPDETALGKCLMIGGEDDAPCNEVIGVVENWHRQDLVEDEQMQYFVPLGQGAEAAPQSFFVRGDPASFGTLLPAIRSEIHAMSGTVRYVIVRPYAEIIDPEARAWRLGATMFSVFGVLALVIAAVGLYGVLAFNVVQRTREIGIRTALGASPERLVGMVMSQGLRLTVVGVGLGLGIALAAGGRIAPLLLNVSARDPYVFGTVVAILLGVAAIAAALPAWRASRVDPNRAFRVD